MKVKDLKSGFVVELFMNLENGNSFESCMIYNTEKEAGDAAEELLTDYGDDADTTVIMYEVNPVASFKMGRIQKTLI